MSAATEVARRIAESTTPDETCRLLAEYAQAQTVVRDGDDPVLLSALRTLDEVRADRIAVDRLSARRAMVFRPWLWLTGAVERLARMRGWAA